MLKYYAQGHTQASIGFALSMTFSVIGFAMIAIAIVQILLHPELPVPASVTGLLGLVNNAVGFLFFRRADKGRDLMMQLVDKLRADRGSEMRFMAGLTAIEQVKAPGLQDALRATAALTFTGSKPTLDQLAGLVNSGAIDFAADATTPRINVFGPQTNSVGGPPNGDQPAHPEHEPASE